MSFLDDFIKFALKKLTFLPIPEKHQTPLPFYNTGLDDCAMRNTQ